LQSGIAHIGPTADPAAVAIAVAHADRVQFDEPLPSVLLDVIARALAKHPEVRFRVYGTALDPSLAFLHDFEHVRHLFIDMWEVSSFDRLGNFRNLITLGLGSARSKRPSLRFVRELPQLETLYIGGHEKDFAAVAELRTLRNLYLNACHVRDISCLERNANLERLAINFGGLRQLQPLAAIPRLRDLKLFQIRQLDSGDLHPLSAMPSLEALALGNLRNVTTLEFLEGNPKTTLQFLELEGLVNLTSLQPLEQCRSLRACCLGASRPRDKSLRPLLAASNLDDVTIGDVYPLTEVAAFRQTFRGQRLWYRGEYLKGGPSTPPTDLAWRRLFQYVDRMRAPRVVPDFLDES
jgi:hypothetical protein